REGGLAGAGRPKQQCARSLLDAAAEQRIELGDTARRLAADEAGAMLRGDQPREHRDSAGADREVVKAAAKGMPAIFRDPEPAPLRAVLRRQLLELEDAMHDAVRRLVRDLRRPVV